ncbi:hypothetical protein Syun_023513 [Stephania yunnanensis]|uniref:Uncharacterized protein n=1 Tax=Stephania yunnanensis TaxID=152371 RepID=A0AAP0I2A8_9MAGN
MKFDDARDSNEVRKPRDLGVGVKCAYRGVRALRGRYVVLRTALGLHTCPCLTANLHSIKYKNAEPRGEEKEDPARSRTSGDSRGKRGGASTGSRSRDGQDRGSRRRGGRGRWRGCGGMTTQTCGAAVLQPTDNSGGADEPAGQRAAREAAALGIADHQQHQWRDDSSGGSVDEAAAAASTSASHWCGNRERRDNGSPLPRRRRGDSGGDATTTMTR